MMSHSWLLSITAFATLATACAEEPDEIEAWIDSAGMDERSDSPGRARFGGWLACPRYKQEEIKCPGTGSDVATGEITVYRSRRWADGVSVELENYVVIAQACNVILDVHDPMLDRRQDWNNYACRVTVYDRVRDQPKEGPFYILGRVESPDREPSFPYVKIDPDTNTFTTKRSSSGRLAQIYSGLPSAEKTLGTVSAGQTYKYDDSIVWGPLNRTTQSGGSYKAFYFRLEKTEVPEDPQ